MFWIFAALPVAAVNEEEMIVPAAAAADDLMNARLFRMIGD
jgi:hypothetical protein